VSNLSFFDPSCRSTDLTVDALSHTLGAYLSSNGNVIAYISRSLNKTEAKYAQLEKELYAIVFWCKQFYYYLYGRKVNAKADHKPLDNIVSKPLKKAPTRIQQILLQIQPYDLTLIF